MKTLPTFRYLTSDNIYRLMSVSKQNLLTSITTPDFLFESMQYTKRFIRISCQEIDRYEIINVSEAIENFIRTV